MIQDLPVQRDLKDTQYHLHIPTPEEAFLYPAHSLPEDTTSSASQNPQLDCEAPACFINRKPL